MQFAAALEAARSLQISGTKDHAFERMKFAVNHGMAALYAKR